jgi:osmotically-inducible protein OsmY
MKLYRPSLLAFTLIAAAALGGCDNAPAKSPDVSDSLRRALDGSGLKDVSVKQDRDKGVVTLSGRVRADNDKAQAESIARSIAGVQVVANQIVVVPAGGESEARAVNADLDAGIESNLDAALLQNKLRKGVSFKVRSGVVTLTGEVASETRRTDVENAAARVPNVLQVVNELQAKNQKATSSN